MPVREKPRSALVDQARPTGAALHRGAWQSATTCGAVTAASRHVTGQARSSRSGRNWRWMRFGLRRKAECRKGTIAHASPSICCAPHGAMLAAMPASRTAIPLETKGSAAAARHRAARRRQDHRAQGAGRPGLGNHRQLPGPPAGTADRRPAEAPHNLPAPLAIGFDCRTRGFDPHDDHRAGQGAQPSAPIWN
jgi:hypothetical protein